MVFRRLLALPGVYVSLAAVAAALAFAPAAFGQGGTWVSSHPQGIRGRDWLSLFPDGTGFSFRDGGNVNSQTLFVTRNFGESWAVKSRPPVSFTATVGFATSSVGYAHGNGDLVRSDDAGDSWNERRGVPDPAGGFTFYDHLGLAAGGGTVAFGAQIYEARDLCDADGPERDPNERPGFLATSHDGGATFRLVQVPGNGSVRDLHLFDGRHGIASIYLMRWTVSSDGVCTGNGTDSAVVVTHDGGESWREVLRCAPACPAVTMAAPYRLFAGRFNGTVLRSEDGGASWIPTELPADVSHPDVAKDALWVTGIRFADCQFGYAATSGRGIWRTNDGGRSWHEELAAAEGFHLAIGGLAVADWHHALATGPDGVLRRLPGPSATEGATEREDCDRLAAQAPPSPPAPPAHAGPGGGPAESSGPSRPPARSIRVDVRPRRIVAGRRVRLTVRVRDAARRPLRGARVRLIPGRRMSVAGQTTTRSDSRGVARLKVRVRRPGQLTLEIRSGSSVAHRTLRVRRAS